MQDFNVIPQCEETCILLQQNDTQSKQHIGVGVDLVHLLAKCCYYYNSVPPHNSLIQLAQLQIKKLIFYSKHMVLTTSLQLVPDLYLISAEEKHAFLSFISFIQPKESNQVLLSPPFCPLTSLISIFLFHSHLGPEGEVLRSGLVFLVLLIKKCQSVRRYILLSCPTIYIGTICCYVLHLYSAHCYCSYQHAM